MFSKLTKSMWRPPRSARYVLLARYVASDHDLSSGGRKQGVSLLARRLENASVCKHVGRIRLVHVTCCVVWAWPWLI